jgi:DNA-binding NarL/FixJ family response regulator
MSEELTPESGLIENTSIHAKTANLAERGIAGNVKVPDGSLLIIDSRILTRECLAQSLRTYNVGLNVATCGSVAEWNREAEMHPPVSAILLIAGEVQLKEDKIEEIRQLVAQFSPIPVLLLADNDDLEDIVRALESGVKGYIPSSVGIAVCAQAIRLALVGGMYVPSSSVLAMRNYIKHKTKTARPMSSIFTQRQAEVVQALRRGKANKIIAYELNMRESTVKVHIRNIMKKLKATNRTEVAYKINDMFPEENRKVVQ